MTAFGTITSQGVGANLDIAGIVSKLMDIERTPLKRLEAKKSTFDARVSALGSIKSKLSALQSSLTGLTYGTSLLASKATSSDTSVVKATGTSSAVAGNYSISNVTQLAQSQKLVAAGQADKTAAIGVGTLTIDLGTISGGSFTQYDSATGTGGTYSGASFTANGSGSHDIVIDSSNNSLEGIRDAINAANIGVSATIVNDGDATNPYRLVLSSTNSGSSESIRIAVAGDASLSSLLAQDPTGVQNLSETVTAQNALFEVDGVSISKASNSITDVIQGVTLELTGTTSGTPVTVSASQDVDSAKAAIEAFVKAYNDLNSEIKKQTDSGASGGTAGALESDSATRQILSSIREELTNAPTAVTGSFLNLSSIGVSFQKDGTLALDAATLTTALQTDNTNVSDLFSSADGYATRLNTLVSEMLAPSGTIESRTTGYKDRIKSLDDQKVNLESRLTRTEQRLRAQYTALDVAISSMTTTSNYLTQQIASLKSL